MPHHQEPVPPQPPLETFVVKQDEYGHSFHYQNPDGDVGGDSNASAGPEKRQPSRRSAELALLKNELSELRAQAELLVAEQDDLREALAHEVSEVARAHEKLCACRSQLDEVLEASRTDYSDMSIMWDP